MLISRKLATPKMIASDVGIARPATSSGIPAAMTEAKTSRRMSRAIGRLTVSALRRSFSDWAALSSWSGA